MFGRRRKRKPTTAQRMWRALGEMPDQFAGQVQVSADGETLFLSAAIPSATLDALIDRLPRPERGPYADRDDA